MCCACYIKIDLDSHDHVSIVSVTMMEEKQTENWLQFYTEPRGFKVHVGNSQNNLGDNVSHSNSHSDLFSQEKKKKKNWKKHFFFKPKMNITHILFVCLFFFFQPSC